MPRAHEAHSSPPVADGVLDSSSMNQSLTYGHGLAVHSTLSLTAEHAAEQVKVTGASCHAVNVRVVCDYSYAVVVVVASSLHRRQTSHSATSNACIFDCSSFLVQCTCTSVPVFGLQDIY